MKNAVLLLVLAGLLIGLAVRVAARRAGRVGAGGMLDPRA